MPNTADKPSESKRHKTKLLLLVDAEPSTQSSKDVQSSATAELGATGKSAEQKAVAPPRCLYKGWVGTGRREEPRENRRFSAADVVLMFHAQT